MRMRIQDSFRKARRRASVARRSKALATPLAPLPTLEQLFPYSFLFTTMTIKLKSFLALLAKLRQLLNFVTLSNDQNPATDLLNREMLLKIREVNI